MKLYYSPAACSLASHIVLSETGAKFTIEPVNLKTHHFKGGDFYKTNPKGYVPALELDNGQLLTEGAVILQYIADQKPETNLMPKAGSMERYRAQEWLNYVATEIHKSFAPLWNPNLPSEYRTIVLEGLAKKFDFLATHLKSHQFLMGAQFTSPDAYLFTVLNWAPMVKVDLTKWPELMGFIERVKQRPAVQATLKAEGLL
jgi:glutathione S-transferase